MDVFPSVYPTWVTHWTGHRRIVESDEEVAALAPGYYYDDNELANALTALGLEWKPLNGPFAPVSMPQVYPSPPRGALCVLARRGLVYHGGARVRGEVFLREDRMEDDSHLASGAIRAYLRGGQHRYRHRETGRYLADETELAKYILGYDNLDITGLGFEWPPAAPAQSDHVPAASSSPGRGRPKGTAELAKLSWEEFFDALRRAGVKALASHTGKGHPKSVAIAAAFGSDRRPLRNKLRENGYAWETIYPLLFPDWYR